MYVMTIYQQLLPKLLSVLCTKAGGGVKEVSAPRLSTLWLRLTYAVTSRQSYRDQINRQKMSVQTHRPGHHPRLHGDPFELNCSRSTANRR